jgi:hypothetical protein
VITAIKIVLASVLVVIATYQVMLALVGYGKVQPPFLEGPPAMTAHRAIGGTAVPVAVVVGVLCVSRYEVADAPRRPFSEVASHALPAVRIAARRRPARPWHRRVGHRDV